jgi:hypothetical protein
MNFNVSSRLRPYVSEIRDVFTSVNKILSFRAGGILHSHNRLLSSCTTFNFQIRILSIIIIKVSIRNTL